MAAPTDWIDRIVALEAEGLRRRLRGKLVEVSDHGIVLIGYREGDDTPFNPLFCPWSGIRGIELLEDDQPQPPE